MHHAIRKLSKDTHDYYQVSNEFSSLLESHKISLGFEFFMLVLRGNSHILPSDR